MPFLQAALYETRVCLCNAYFMALASALSLGTAHGIVPQASFSKREVGTCSWCSDQGHFGGAKASAGVAPQFSFSPAFCACS